MKVKFLDVIQMGTHLFKSGEVGEFSHQTAEELIKKGLAVLEDGNESIETDPEQKPKTGKGGKGKNAEPPKEEKGANGDETKGSDAGSNSSEDVKKSDENTQTPNEETKPE